MSPPADRLARRRAPRRRGAACLWWVATACAAAWQPASAADACTVRLGRGWPPATENHGSAVERLLADSAQPALRLTYLPLRGTETGLLLIPGEGDGDWTVRYAEPEERVANWVNDGRGSRLEFRVGQKVEHADAPIPAALAKRLAGAWRRTLETIVPAGQPAAFHEKDQLLFVAGGVRVSGLRPDCGPGEQLMAQVDLLTEATDDSESRRARRWRELEASLDELDIKLAGTAGRSAGEANGND